MNCRTSFGGCFPCPVRALGEKTHKTLPSHGERLGDRAIISSICNGNYCSWFLFQDGVLKTHQWCSSGLELGVSLILTYPCMILEILVELPDSWGGGGQDQALEVGRKQVSLPREKWGLCTIMLMKEEDKELLAELSTSGAAPRSGVVMLRSRGCWWLSKNCICQTRAQASSCLALLLSKKEGITRYPVLAKMLR